MKRKSWLFEDAADRTRLPFIPHQTQLQLLGFLMPKDSPPAGPVQMLVQHEGRQYAISAAGDARQLRPLRGESGWSPDLVAPEGATTCVGHSAFALSRREVIHGPDWHVRTVLRKRLPGLPPVCAVVVQKYLQEQGPAALMARAYYHAGLEGYMAAGRWLEKRAAAPVPAPSPAVALACLAAPVAPAPVQDVVRVTPLPVPAVRVPVCPA